MIGNHVDDDDDDDDDKEEREGAGAGHPMIGNHVDPKQRHSHQHQCICIPRNQESPLRHALTAPLTSCRSTPISHDPPTSSTEINPPILP